MRAWPPVRLDRSLRASLASLLLAGVAVAQQPISADVDSALDYLRDAQQIDGSYVPLNPLATDYQTTARVGETLGRAQALAAELAVARTFLDAASVTTVEERARRLIAGTSSADVPGLIADQNPDGGFGADSNFESNVLDTAFAAVAVARKGAPIGIVARDVAIGAGEAEIFTIDVPVDGLTLDIVIEAITGAVEVRIGGGMLPTPSDPHFPVATTGIISIAPGGGVPLVPGETHFIEFASPAGATVSFRVDYTATSGDTANLTDALEYLQDARNPDGGWGFLPADENSQLYCTEWAVRALAAGAADASGFALSRELPGGGFADPIGGAATVFDTALGLSIVARSAVDPETSSPTSIAFLEAAQQPDGSFEDDPYRTALSIDALLAARAPLAPSITSNGGAGPGADFTTDLSVVIITGLAPVGATSISVNLAGADVEFDPATGEYTITVALAEGANTIDISASNTAGVAGPIATLVVTRDSSLTAEDVVLGEGFNAVALTLEPANALDAIGLLELLGPEASEVRRLDTTSGLFETLARDGSGGYAGPNFQLTALDGMHVITQSPTSVRIVGSPPGSTEVDLVVGANTLTLPSPPVGLGAFALLAAIGDASVVSALQRFDPDSGAFQTAVYDAGVPAGVDFPIAAGVAYVVSMAQPLTSFQPPVALSVAITSPADGATVTSTPVTVSGTVTGIPPFDVSVNGLPATVVGGTFSVDVPLLEGANAISAVATDAAAEPVNDAITVTLQTVDYSLSPGTFVQDSRVISGSSAVMSQVASIQFFVTGIPPELTYTFLGAFFLSATEVQVDFQIDAVPGAAPGIYSFQVQNQLLDAGGVPLGPLLGDFFDFTVEVTP